MGGETPQPLTYTTRVYVDQIEHACEKMTFTQKMIALGFVVLLTIGPKVASIQSMGKRGAIILLLLCAALAGLVISIASQSWAWGFLSGAMITLLIVEVVRNRR